MINLFRFVKFSMLVCLGLALIIPAIIIGPFCKKLPINTNRPWVDGLIINLLRAYKKYNTVSWIRRCVAVFKHPPVVLEYIKILTNKQSVVRRGRGYIKVDRLKSFHYVQTTHKHHRDRVAAYRNTDTEISSDFGTMIVVGNTVHDGNHRLAAAKEAGRSHLLVDYYEITKE